MRRRCLLATAVTALLVVQASIGPTPATATVGAPSTGTATAGGPGASTVTVVWPETGIAAVGGPETGTRQAGDWTHAAGDAGHSGYQPFTGGLSSADAATLHQVWRVPGLPRGTLVAAGGALYLPAAVQGGGSAILRLDARTGERLPFAVTATGWLGQPAAVDRTVVAIASDEDNRHELRAYTLTGRKRWSVPLRTDRPADDLAVSGGLVFVGGGLDCRYDCATSRLQAFRLSDGTLAWEQDVVGDLQYEAPAVAGDTLVWPMRDATGTRPVAFDAATGSPRWGAPVARGGLSSVVVTADTVYAIEGETLCAWIADSGGKRWCRNDLGYVSVAVAPQRADARDTPSVVYAGGGGMIRALDPADGGELWSARVDGDARPLTAGGGLVFAQLWSPRETRIAVLDAGDGRVLSDRVLNREGIFGTVVPAYGRVFAVDPYEAVLALKP